MHGFIYSTYYNTQKVLIYIVATMFLNQILLKTVPKDEGLQT